MGYRVVAIAANEAEGGSLALSSLAQTDREGRYRLEDMPPGRYYVAVGPLRNVTYYPGVTDVTLATVVSIPGAGGIPSVQNLDFAVAPATVGFKVSGRVIAKEPEGRGVILTNGDITAQVREDANGLFEFSHIPPGVYTLTVPLTRFTRPQSIDLRNGDVTGVEVVVPSTRVITMRVSVRDGGPLPRFAVKQINPGQPIVEIEPPRGGAIKPIAVPSQAEGVFEMVLPEGENRLRLENLPFGYSVEAATYGTTDALRQPINVAADRAEEFVVRLAPSPGPWGRIRGRVAGFENLPSNPAPGVMLRADGLLRPLEAAVAADGSFEFRNVPPALFTATIFGGPFGPVSARVSGEFGETRYVDLTIPAARKVTGRVLAEDGQAPGFSLMGGQSAGAMEFRIPVDIQPDGRFTATLPEGESHIAIAGLDPAYYPKSFEYGDRNLSESALPAAAGSKPEELRVTLGLVASAPRLKVSGRVVGPSPQPPLIRAVKLTSVMPDRVLTVTADANGSFEFNGVVPGVYRLHAQDAVSVNFAPQVIQPGEPIEGALQIVVRDANITDANLIIPQMIRYSGVVRVESGQLPRFSFRVTNESEPVDRRIPIDVRPSVSSDGVLSVTLPVAGPARLELIDLPPSHIVKEFFCGNADLARVPLPGNRPCDFHIVFTPRRTFQIAEAGRNGARH